MPHQQNEVRLPDSKKVERFFADPKAREKTWNDPQRDEWQCPDEIVDALNLKLGATVADIGAGTGYMVAHLSKAVGEHGTVIAIDASAEMIKFLKANRRGMGAARVIPRQAPLLDPKLPSESVDRVLMLDTWLHLQQHIRYARKVRAGLKRGGRVVVVDYAVDAATGPPMTMRWTPKRVTKELEAAGFCVDEVRNSMPRHFIVVGRKPK